MKNQKRVIVLIILAIAITIAVILPLQHIMTGETGGAKAQIAPWFKVNVPYAYVNLNQAGTNNTMNWDGAQIQAIANFTLTPEAIALKDADAQIEFYQFHLYSDQGSIVNITYSVAVSRSETYSPETAGRQGIGITGSGGNIFNFADGTTYDANPVIGESITGGGQVLFNNPELPERDYTVASVGSYIADYNGENSNPVLANLRNTQVLYLEVSRIFSITYQENAEPATTTTLASNEILCQIELTKINDGFVYGTYTEGTLPTPVQVPNK